MDTAPKQSGSTKTMMAINISLITNSQIFSSPVYLIQNTQLDCSYHLINTKLAINVLYYQINSAQIIDKSNFLTNFYQQTQTHNTFSSNKLMYQRNSSPTREHPQSVQKEATVNHLRKQLLSLQNVEHEYHAVQDEIQNAETNMNLIAAEKDRIDSEKQTKIDLNSRAIQEHRSDYNALKLQLHKCNTHIDQLIRDNEGLKRTCHNRDNEISTLLSGNQEIQKKNQHQLQLNKGLSNQIRSLKQERNRKQLECQRLQTQLEDNIGNLKSLQKQARMLDSSVSKLQNILLIAQKDHSDLIEEMRTREHVVDEQNKKLRELNQEIEALKGKTHALQQDCIRSQNDYRAACDSLENMAGKNRQLVKRLKTSEGLMRQAENQHDRLVLERDGHETQHMELYEQNKLLNEDIDRVLRQILEYERVSKQLQAQAAHYAECDQQARAILNRKEGINQLLHEVSSRLAKTGDPISHLTGQVTRGHSNARR